jgi:6,7-dimethyl-8-ribityllumazine synthase
MRKEPKNWRIGIVVSEFNIHITKLLLQSCREELVRVGVKKTNIQTRWVSGAYEIPYFAKKMAESKKFDAIICLGCIIKGETSHDLHIANWASIGIGLVSLWTKVPVLFGVLTPKTESQALRRARPGPLNRGKEVAQSAIHIIQVNQEKF